MKATEEQIKTIRTQFSLCYGEYVRAIAFKQTRKAYTERESMLTIYELALRLFPDSMEEIHAEWEMQDAYVDSVKEMYGWDTDAHERICADIFEQTDFLN